MTELIGILAAIIIFASVSFSSTTVRRNILMRILNICGSALFVWYGILISSVSNIVLNGGMILINVYYIWSMLKLENTQTKKELINNDENSNKSQNL